MGLTLQFFINVNGACFCPVFSSFTQIFMGNGPLSCFFLLVGDGFSESENESIATALL